MNEADNPLRKIFLEALEIADAQQRADYLSQACGTDSALRREVEELLSAQSKAGQFLPDRGATGASWLALLNALGSNIPPALQTENAGNRVGRYKLLEKLGEGGCGVVYLAEQEEPVRRKVALKVIKLGMDTKQVIARFEAERQALALMDHPNIAKVLDAGATETGRPYFVMELVKGIRITDYCNQHHLPTAERLGLFTQICQAIQHAHQKGIIHRDIKPSNILVTLHDGVPVPKVIDFGIAKATEQALTEKTVFTALGQFMGTPAYMSPEQAQLSGLDIDTRSDIYALGVLLYELLTGRTPFDAKELLQAGLDEMRRRIREEEPMRPSTRLSTMSDADLTKVAQQRRSESAKLARFIRGDLDWIVMKCLEKDRSRRYETANGLARDIERHLDNEPVVAGPPSNLYRFQKLLRRNRSAFAAAAIAVVVLLTGVGAITWQAVRATRAEREQSRLRERAQTAQANEARQRSRAEDAASQEAEQRAVAQALAEKNRINLYAARIKLAEQTFRDGDVPRVMELLDSLRPQEGQEDLRSFDWYYLWQMCHSERLACPNAGRVLSTTFSPDGRMLAFAGDKGTVRLCDAATGTERAQLTGHTGRVGSVAFCPDGKRIASAGADATIRFWDVNTGKELQKFQIGTNPIAVLTFSADGTLLAAGEGEVSGDSGNPAITYFPHGSAGGIAIWNTTNFQLQRMFQGDTNGILGLAFSPDGRKIAFSGGRGQFSVQLYDVAENRQLATQTNFQGHVMGLTFTSDGRELIAGDWYPWHDSGRILALDALTLEQKRIIAPDAGPVLCIALSPDGKKIASGGVDRVARLWDYASGDEIATFHGHGRPIVSLAFTPDARGLATAGWDNMVRVWNLETSPARQRIETPQNFSVAFFPNGKLLASAGNGAEVREVVSGRLIRSMTEFTTQGDGHIAFSPDGSRLAAAEIDGTLHVWDTQTWKHCVASNNPAILVFSGFPFPGDMLAFSADGRRMVEGFGRLIPFWNASDVALTGIITNATVPTALAFTPDEKKLLVGSDRWISLVDLATKKSSVSFSASCRRVAVSTDGRWAASSPLSAPNNITLRDLPDLRIRARLDGHTDVVYSLAFSHDGRLLASGSWDGTVRIWHLASGQELLSIPSMGGVVWSVAFAPDDRTLAFGSGSARNKRSGAITFLRAATDADVSRARRFVRLPLPSRGEIPNRPEGSHANLINLTEFYTATFSNFGFSELNLGIQTLGGVQFDFRGIVQLSCSNPDMTYDHSASIRGIQVGLRCHALHFLHAASWAEEGGTTIGEYLIHFMDGRLARLPLVYGENISDWLFAPDDPPEQSAATKLVWQGENATSKRYGREVRLYDFRWQNPHPESEIKSIDFESSLTQSAPFLMAITAED